MDKIFKLFEDNHNFKIGKLLGKGGFGEVREIKMNGKTYAGKLVKMKHKNDINGKKEDNILLYLKSPNIVKIHKIFNKKYNNNGIEETYNLIIMEKSVLKNLNSFNKYLVNMKKYTIINNPFNEEIGDNLLKFFCRQIVNALELLDRNELIHFDIKPENILIFLELSLKLSDFGLLKDVSQAKNIKIPGGTPGYMSPEFFSYKSKKIPIDMAKKQDYFALGATIYLLKYGRLMIKVNKSEDDIIKQENIIDIIQREIVFIKSNIVGDKDFVNFLCSLIQILPEDRPSFERIYRNKWINKDSDYLSKLVKITGDDEEKLIMELKKSDYLFEKERYFKKSQNKRNKFVLSKKIFKYKFKK